MNGPTGLLTLPVLYDSCAGASDDEEHGRLVGRRWWSPVRLQHRPTDPPSPFSFAGWTKNVAALPRVASRCTRDISWDRKVF